MIVVPHLIITHQDCILLLKRSMNAKIWPGKWHCVTGSIEMGETPQEAIIREGKEELNISIHPPKLATTVHAIEKDFLCENQEFFALELFFLYNPNKKLQLINNEPHKHSEIAWFDIHNLPKNMIPSVEFGIKAFLNGKNYSEFRQL